MTISDSAADKYRVLQDYFGYTQFRNGQEPIIDALLNGQDVLGVMPTGAGKSLCYQIPALMFDGITLVVSPLISLMKDQVAALGQTGIKAAYINSSLSAMQYRSVIDNASAGMYKIIYVAPERLETPSFVSLVNQINISMIAVDEAHCISQWGQDFRPSYMRIPNFINSLKHRPVTGAFTATATDKVKDDIIRILGLHSPLKITTGFDRSNLYFGVIHTSTKYQQTLDIIRENKDKCGIIYCATRKNVEDVCQKLNEDGIPCTRYHAGLSDEERHTNQDKFIYDKVNVIAATNAFGMGIDKSNIEYIFHYNMPKNIESYYQEAGRAGRDGSEAKCILLYNGQDIMTNRYLIEHAEENPDLTAEQQEVVRQNHLQKLREMIHYCNTSSCLRAYILNYFGEQHGGHCGNCSSCLDNSERTDVTIDAQKILSCVYRLKQRRLSFGKIVISAILQGADNEKINQFGLKTLSTYGIMKDRTQKQIRAIIDMLYADGYLAEGEYNTLVLTERADDIFKNKVKITMTLSKDKPDKAKDKSLSGQTVSYFDKELFVRLAAIRFRIAKKINMPPYIIFSDATLKEMSAKKPVTEEAMLSISGVGKVKLANYGAEFIAAIRQYIDSHPHSDNEMSSQNEPDTGIKSDEPLSDIIIR
ncbi:MAG: DNA helicase RecQ, partial [Spirochaetales bacterium]|nr:DNA helicase RecQ [Spirochaetales bacterium]